MGDSKTIQVPVEVDFTGISYDAASNHWTVPSDAPAFSLKGRTGKGVGKTVVKPGNNTLVWTVSAKGYSKDLIPSLPTGGISFDAKDNPKWPFDQPLPVLNANMSYTVADDYPSGSPDATYGYTITVRLTSTSTPSASIDFKHDPDVENQGSNTEPTDHQ